MENIVPLLERYGLPTALLAVSTIALAKIIMWSLISVREEFSKRHEDNAKAVAELNAAVASLTTAVSSMRADISILVAFVKDRR